MNSWLSALLDIIYPPKCPVCRKAVDEHGAWCPDCLGNVTAVRELSMMEHRLRYLDGCLAIYAYVGGMKRLLHDMKFRRMDKYARHLTWALKLGLFKTGRSFSNIELVIPVPLHRERLAERSYNQTSLIFRPWAEAERLTWAEEVLIRTRPTVPQWELNLTDRRKNIKGAFVVKHSQLVSGRHIILVDDIFTSGTTLDECAKVLKAAGAAKVTALVLASGAN